tara:strand:- start:1591 stop:2157 length:567 start_codon:yes stop_codon:yes gene_type:complete
MEAQIDKLYKPLFLYVRKRINSQEDAEDLTQEIFLKLSKSDSEKIDNVKSWVYTIAKNTITDYYRKKKVHTEELEENIATKEFNNDNIAKDLSNCISPYLHKLPTELKEIMTLSKLKDIPQKEIANQLDINYITVRSKTQRGRKKLKSIFTECCTVSQGAKGSIIGFEKNTECSTNCDDNSKNEKSNC